MTSGQHPPARGFEQIFDIQRISFATTESRTKMDDGGDSAVQRTPEEVWWLILDEVIDEPLLFATIYEGNDWSNDAPKSKRRLYERFEKQKKIIGSVCRSWQLFARSTRYRRVVLGYPKNLALDTTQKARYAFLCGPYAFKSPSAQGLRVEWETLRLKNATILPRVASTLSCPRLRRLELSYLDYDANAASRFADILGVFPGITWLECDICLPQYARIIPVNQPPILLPKVEIFWCKCQHNGAFPLSNLILPSLRYLYIVFDASTVWIPLLDILRAYRHSIQSVVMKTTNNAYLEGIIFPSWNDFPNLKEMQLHKAWSVIFEPLPSTHPLQKLGAQFTSFNVIPSLLQGVNMRHLTLRRTRWTASGMLRGKSQQMMDPATAAELWEYAKARGIWFDVPRQGVMFNDREEAIADATARR
ncbi:hypothetical protein CPB86DRAFT_878317 [Serendipita vermifera]|nr:hypothetical protein CPB86DRAFT_878317 [Serendipita vermifera]